VILHNLFHSLSELLPDLREFAGRKMWQRVIPHVMALREHPQEDWETEDAGRVLHLAGTFLHQGGSLEEAGAAWRDAIRVRERVLGPLHPDVARSRYNLTVNLQHLGRYTEAISEYYQLLETQEQQSRTENLDVARTLISLGGALNEIERCSEAEPLLLRAVSYLESASTVEPNDLACAVQNLAFTYHHSRKDQPELAERYYRRSWEVREAGYGPDDPRVADSLNGLMVFCLDQKRLKEAEILARRSLQIRIDAFGPDALIVSQSLNNVAAALMEQGRFLEAEPLLLRALSIRRKLLPRAHPYIATCHGNLGEVYQEMGLFQKSKPYLLRALALRKATLGEWHSHTAESVVALAILFSKTGREADAARLKAKADEILERRRNERET
jgi:tetratricopeptide (TPR) repeat protein